MFEAFDSIYIVYLSAFAAAIFAVEAAYLVLAAPRSYRNSVNHRLRMMRDSLDRESILLQLRRERWWPVWRSPCSPAWPSSSAFCGSPPSSLSRPRHSARSRS
jgi:hypothetical protein